ncbi:MAG: hypothetical protein PHX18_02990 [Candidatus Gastranaerophilales bacterium]|nr:hypothetical protein [Candidatus Gastranaerophilales bacterium]
MIGAVTRSVYKYANNIRPGNNFNRANRLNPEVVRELDQRLAVLKQKHAVLSERTDAGDQTAYAPLFDVVQEIINIREKFKPKTSW